MIITHLMKNEVQNGYTINFDVTDQTEKLANVHITDIDKTDEHYTYCMETRAFCDREDLSYDYYQDRMQMFKIIEDNYEKVKDALYYLGNAYIESVFEEETSNPSIEDIDLDDGYFIKHKVLFNSRNNLIELIENNDSLRMQEFKTLTLQKK